MQRYSPYFVRVFARTILTLCIVYQIANSTLAYVSGVPVNKYLSWVPSFFIVGIALLIRFAGNRTSAGEASAPEPYIRLLSIAMCVGLLATVTIYYHFLAGAGLYLVMHVVLLVGFHRLFSIHPADWARNGQLGRNFFLSGLAMSVVLTVFFLFVYKGTKTLILLPYVIMLGLMATCAMLSLFQRQIPVATRLLIATGGFVFVVSDLIIGLTMHLGPDSWPPIRYVINPTYVAAISCLQMSSIPLLATQQ